DRALTGSADTDASTILRAIRNGHLYVAVDGIATPPSFEFSASNDFGTVHEGDELAVGGPVTLHVRSNAPPRFTTIVWDGATMVSEQNGPEMTVQAPAGPAVYWIEIRSSGGNPLAWVRSNPIYLR